MAEDVKNIIIVALELALFIVIAGFSLEHLKAEEAHEARYAYTQEKIADLETEVRELRRELQTNDAIMLKVLNKEW